MSFSVACTCSQPVVCMNVPNKSAVSNLCGDGPFCSCFRLASFLQLSYGDGPVWLVLEMASVSCFGAGQLLQNSLLEMASLQPRFGDGTVLSSFERDGQFCRLILRRPVFTVLEMDNLKLVSTVEILQQSEI
ncbi:hypothetical protein AVEN_99752-1 [Araneus ventricosus]|uniref:Uncharacterized protein n=1 Tax=Araneus ventricosus TaxID=182803 RepID=A0A4Y2DKY5_ARAVE|nr:hypothetical protein AVEN_99752-1 [Araneus ventricosus]